MSDSRSAKARREVPLQIDGLPVPGVHELAWNELRAQFGANPWRLTRLRRLHALVGHLKSAGCSEVWVFGSSVSTKPDPSDFDVIYRQSEADRSRLDRVLLANPDVDSGAELAVAQRFGGSVLAVEFYPGALDDAQRRNRWNKAVGVVRLPLSSVPETFD